MGGAIQYVYWQGQRLTPWMLYVLLILDERLWARWRVRLVLVSAIRLYEEQKAIFLQRYVTAGNINGRRVYDTRWWNGQRWYRISPAGTVAVPSTSNHEIQGDIAAVDIQDTGNDPGITAKNSERGRWLRHVFGPEFGMDPEGDNFAEGWHHRLRGIFRTPPAAPAGKPTSTASKPVQPEEEDEDMIIIVQRSNSQLSKARLLPSGRTREITPAENVVYRSLEGKGHAVFVTVTDKVYANLLSGSKARV